DLDWWWGKVRATSPGIPAAAVNHLHPLAPVRKRQGSGLSLAFLFLLTVVCSITPGSAQDALSAKQPINIAFVEIENDPRYAPVRAYERIILKTRAHPFAGAELGFDDAAPLARVLKADFRP